jgi:1,4-dihydroxy-2-naphthoyl-CoA hydrolase
MPFNCDYTVQFRDTDAAGVVYFASILSICHVAYEASLVAAGIELKSFVHNPECAVPIAHVSADFLRPLYCGDLLKIELIPTRSDECKFEIAYRILIVAESAESERKLDVAAMATTKHVTIDPQLRKRRELPANIVNWLDRWQ